MTAVVCCVRCGVLRGGVSCECLQAGLARRVSLFLSDVETGIWSAGDVMGVAAAVERVLVTEGEKGAVEYVGRSITRVPPVRVSDCGLVGAFCGGAHGLWLNYPQPPKKKLNPKP